MAIDPSIALQFKQPKLLGPADAISLKQLAQQNEMQGMQMQEMRRKHEEEQQVRQILSRPGATDDKGGLSPVALSQITAVSPKTGMQFREQEQKRIAQATDMYLKQQQIGQNEQEFIHRFLTGEYAKHKNRPSGVSEQDYLPQFVQSVRTSIDEAVRAGQVRPAVAEAMKANLTSPDAVLGAIAGSKPHKEFVAADQKEDAAPKTRTRVAGTEEVQEQWDPQTRTWKEIGRGPRFARQVAPVVNIRGDGGGGGGKAPSGYRFKSDGTLEPIPGGPADKKSAGETGDYNLTGQAFLDTIPQSDRTLVKKLANYEIDPKSLSTRGGQRERLLSMASQYDPTYDQKEYNATNQAINRFATGPQGNTARSLNVAIEHMDTARRLGDALKNGNFPMFNRVANEIATQTGKPAPTSFNAVKEIVADEVVKGVIGGAGALADREAAAKKIRDAASPSQMNAVLDAWTELLGGQLKGIEKQYEGATRRKDFRERYMTARSREAIASHEGGGKGGQPASQGAKDIPGPPATPGNRKPLSAFGG